MSYSVAVMAIPVPKPGNFGGISPGVSPSYGGSLSTIPEDSAVTESFHSAYSTPFSGEPLNPFGG